ncbi:heme peroxidase-domain-containing protein [Cercophora newfieldiana]|uniref:Heme peroxidase-domain-containing protein n=1 Tax=Cercophora newfieldiana TaxID=92897 RepID=A0AA39YAZ0_9PEZI|nr:heme peroxidase-domain-containing protein [Cercophora newfieldiana]
MAPSPSLPVSGTNGVNGVNGSSQHKSGKDGELEELNKQLNNKDSYIPGFHGDALIGNRQVVKTGKLADLREVLTLPHLPDVLVVARKMLAGGGLDIKAGAPLIGSLPITSAVRADLVEKQVKAKYERMLHPPLTYLGGAFKYRTADGKFNSALFPHLGQAGAPYAKTVPAVTHPLGALPDPGDLFDRLMARNTDRPSKSGLSSMLVYHATIIIHDIFRTNERDKNISDTSSYLDLSPLYGFTEEMQRKVRDGKHKLGLLKPDTFAEDRLLRQPPGVCIMLVMYNRYHNYAATQLRRINENGRFSVPLKYQKPRPLATVETLATDKTKASEAYLKALAQFEEAYKVFKKNGEETTKSYEAACKALEDAARPPNTKPEDYKKQVELFHKQYDAAWDKLDDDLFNTARLITCGMYIQISIHDYLRALMGFHQFNTNFTLDPRVHETTAKTVSRGIGNQVTVEFNLLYRFHCAISVKDEAYTEEFMREMFHKSKEWDPKDLPLDQFLGEMQESRARDAGCAKEPEDQEFGLKTGPNHFQRNPVTKLFDDKQMVKALTEAMDDPISNFGPCNVPRSLKAVEIMGILQARKWEIGTLNDFRQFFGMKRHETFESISKDPGVQNALRDLYEHPDKVELYPGVFCESDGNMSGDPGPSDLDSALWAAIFSDAITLVRSDRFYTVDWNTNSLTSWGMKEVTPDADVLKSSVFHRLLQRAFPGWFPADSVRFFHPFYTGQQNATYAWEQKLDGGLKMKTKHIAKRDWRGKRKNPNEKDEFDISASDPKKPQKPLYLSDVSTIRAVLEDPSDTIVHPARLNLDGLPEDIKHVLETRQTPSEKKVTIAFEEDLAALSADLIAGMRNIIKRECITIDPNRPSGSVFQIDVARDFAVPVVTKYVADFLGLGHLIRSDTNMTAPYSENEIYQHITNCQVYLSYNADETKVLKRRKAFQASMAFLFDLTLNKGNVSRAAKRQLQQFRRLFGTNSKPKSLETLGFTIAQEILSHESNNKGRAAAILLLVGLDNAYNTVIAFNSVLNTFISGLYKQPESGSATLCDWLKIQQLVFEEPSTDARAKAIDNEITLIVLATQRQSVKLPIVRRAIEERTITDPVTKKALSLSANQTIICDYNPDASLPSTAFNPDLSFLAHRSPFTSTVSLAPYHPKHLTTLLLTSMIRVLATLRNLRRGHTSQGHLKRIRIDASSEPYSNYMAPQRVRKIAADVAAGLAEAQSISDPKKRKEKEDYWKAIYTPSILRPETATYLTPEWDEMVPFPTTWKLRFDGFGRSLYDMGKLKGETVPGSYDFAPFYEAPGGISRVGGSFAASSCVCVESAQRGGGCKCGLGGEGGKGKSEGGGGYGVYGLTPGTGGCGLQGR